MTLWMPSRRSSTASTCVRSMPSRKRATTRPPCLPPWTTPIYRPAAPMLSTLPRLCWTSCRAWTMPPCRARSPAFWWQRIWHPRRRCGWTRACCWASSPGRAAPTATPPFWPAKNYKLFALIQPILALKYAPDWGLTISRATWASSGVSTRVTLPSISRRALVAASPASALLPKASA